MALQRGRRRSRQAKLPNEPIEKEPVPDWYHIDGYGKTEEKRANIKKELAKLTRDLNEEHAKLWGW
jgi:hypothetical protein